MFEGGAKVIHSSQVNTHFLGCTSLPPVISIYARSKPLQVATHLIEKIQKVWQEKSQGAKKIFVIGANPNVKDHHIWDYITKSQAILYYVGNETAFENYTQKYRSSKNNIFINNTFIDSFNNLLGLITES